MVRGEFTLVGAGPGDPELISMKGVKALASADVILYDALVHPDLLQHAKSEAEKIYVGKRASNHTYTQSETNQMIVDFALKGKHVVRLKGGDPFIFGRGQEEIDYASERGVPCSAVLGISSINLPGYYGIPLTKRGVNESFWVVTATTSSGKLSDDVKLAAKSTATSVFLMGLHKLQEIIAIFQKEGKHDLPVVIISKGSHERGKLHFGTVDTIVSIKENEQVEAPSIIVIGKVVAENAAFYEKLRKV